MKCPLNRKIIAACPRKVATGKFNECQCCLDEWSERAAIIEHDGRQSRDVAEMAATEILRKQLERLESPQIGLKL